MATTYVNLQDDVLRFIALSNNTDARTYVKRALNEAARDVWMAWPWRERRARAFVNTVAPYTTGTVTVTNNSTTVTGSGTTFTSAMVGRKFALSYASPWYTISAYVSATEVTLARAYTDDTASSQNYTIYDDILTLATMDTLLTNEVVLFKQGDDIPMDDMTSRGMFDWGYFPRSAGTPDKFRVIEDSGTATKIQVWPAPDDVYAIYYPYLKTYTDMSSDSDECAVPESRRDIVRIGATARGFRYNEEYEKAEVEERRFEAKLNDAIRRERRVHPLKGVLKSFDHGEYQRGLGGFTIDWTRL